MLPAYVQHEAKINDRTYNVSHCHERNKFSVTDPITLDTAYDNDGTEDHQDHNHMITVRYPESSGHICRNGIYLSHIADTEGASTAE